MAKTETRKLNVERTLWMLSMNGADMTQLAKMLMYRNADSLQRSIRGGSLPIVKLEALAAYLGVPIEELTTVEEPPKDDNDIVQALQAIATAIEGLKEVLNVKA